VGEIGFNAALAGHFMSGFYQATRRLRRGWALLPHILAVRKKGWVLLRTVPSPNKRKPYPSIRQAGTI